MCRDVDDALHRHDFVAGAIPLFINTIGAWPSRPSPSTRFANLSLAGGYVKNLVDLACLEGAVSAALSASAAILRAYLPSRKLRMPAKVFLHPAWQAA